MTPLTLGELPAALYRVAVAAVEKGWRVTATHADGPPASIVLRFAQQGSTVVDVWARWNVDKGASWQGGATRRGGHVRRRSDLFAALGVE